MRHATNVILSLCFGAVLLAASLDPASAAPPASCASKFVGTWSVTVLATGQTYRSQIRADGTLSSACPLCPAVQTWTCSGNTFILTSPVHHTSTLSPDGRRMGGGCCSSVRIGGGPVVAAKSPAKERRLPDPGTLSPAQAAKCPLPANAKANIEKDFREYTDWIENPRRQDDRAKGHNNRANVYFSYRRFDLSIKDREAERKLTGKVLCQRCLAQAYLANGQFDRAIAELDPIARPDRADVYCTRGMAHHQKGDYDRALQDYEVAMLAPDDFRNCGLFGRGLTKLKLGDRAGGQDDMAAAEAADAKTKHPVGYEQYFCIHGVIAEPASAAGPPPPQSIKRPAETDMTKLFSGLVAWQARMKEANIPSVAPHLLVAPPCPACSPAGFYCAMPVKSVSDLKGKRVALGPDERELGQQLFSVGASISPVPSADTYPALEKGLIDCVGGTR